MAKEKVPRHLHLKWFEVRESKILLSGKKYWVNFVVLIVPSLGKDEKGLTLLVLDPPYSPGWGSWKE